MKIVLLVIVIIVLVFLIFQIYTAMATGKSETQPYQVIKIENDFEIRFYPTATMAVITSSAKTYKELGSSGFTPLAAYIFGGNNEKKQIAMTAPVHMEINDTLSSMSFVMPAQYTKANLPEPNNADITLTTTPAEYVAAITFGGFASQEAIKKHTVLLEKALKEKQLSYHGPFRYFGYNPPYQVVGRRNEIIVALEEKEVNQIR